jgi:hypothetical protein
MAYDNQGQRVLIAPPAPGAPQPRPEDQPNAAPSRNTFELLMLSTESSSCGSTTKGNREGDNESWGRDDLSRADRAEIKKALHFITV